MSYLPSSPGKTHLVDLLKNYPRRSQTTLALIEDIMYANSVLSRHQRDAIFTYAAAFSAGSLRDPISALVSTGTDFDNGEELNVDIDLKRLELHAGWQVILHFVSKLTRSPSQVNKADVDAIFAAGWNEGTVVDLVSICALANYLHRFVSGLGVDLAVEHAP